MITTEHNATLTHHMVDNGIETAFDQFIKHFPFTNINVQEGYINYTLKVIEQAESIKGIADDLISRLKLELKTSLKIHRYNAVLTIEPK